MVLRVRVTFVVISQGGILSANKSRQIIQSNECTPEPAE